MLSQASILALLLLPLQCLAQATNYGPQLTDAALKIQSSISPTCNATESCIQFVSYVIPRCQRLQGDAGCWCGNHDPLHYCAICMSSPSDNRTTPDQTAAAIEGHTSYHQACNLFEVSLNSSSTASAGPSSTSGPAATNAASTTGTSSKTPIGAIVGGAVGGGVAVIIGAIVLTIWLKQRKKKSPGPSSVSLFSAAGTSTGYDPSRPYSGYGQPEASFAHRDNALGHGYAPASMPYQEMGMHSPPLMSDGSYNKHPEPMVPQ